MRSPTERSLAYLRKRGYSCKVCEKWVPMGAPDPNLPVWQQARRQDLWGCDIEGIHDDPAVPHIRVQTTSASNHAARIAKLLEIPELRWWTLHGDYVECHSWGTRKKDGKDHWCGRIERMQIDALGQPVFVRVDEVWSPKRAAAKRSRTGVRPGQRGSLLRDLYG